MDEEEAAAEGDTLDDPPGGPITPEELESMGIKLGKVDEPKRDEL